MSIELGQMLILKIPQPLIEECWLSVPGWEQLKGGNGLCRDRKRASQDPKFAQLGFKLPYRSYDEKCCLLPYEKHLQTFGLKPKDPWLIVGIRNLGNNIRIIGWDYRQGLLELNGENAASGREYCCLCKTRDGRLSIERLSFLNGKLNRDDLVWAASGQELVWEGEPAPIDKIVAYTYDLRHVWQIPGGLLPEMGPHANAGALIEEMADKFIEVADFTFEDAAQRLIDFATAKGYKRESNYLHSAIGISKDGETLITIQRHGRFEDVAKSLIHAGAYKAIELDQGGSCGVMMGGSDEFNPGRIILASHYFRPRGLALLVFSLKELSFSESSALLD